MEIQAKSVAASLSAPAAAPQPEPAARPGKSGQSVGHLAKAAVAGARTAGADLPKNAQGYVASMIAQGAAPAAVCALPAPDTAQAETVATGDEVSNQASDGYATALTLIAPATGDETATS